MHSHIAAAALAAAVIAGLSITARAAGTRTFAVEAEQSRAIIDVGKSGAFSFAGHTHEIEAPLTGGVVHLDAADPSRADVRLEFNAAAMRVTGKGESADDVPKVTETMLGAMVLDVKRYPTISFESMSVAAKSSSSATALDLTVTGRLAIRGKTQTVSAPVAVKLAGERLTATGKFAIRQTDFGITPISVGGVVKVKNELTISFTIVARGGA